MMHVYPISVTITYAKLMKMNLNLTSQYGSHMTLNEIQQALADEVSEIMAQLPWRHLYIPQSHEIVLKADGVVILTDEALQRAARAGSVFKAKIVPHPENV